MIRKMERSDLDAVAAIWPDGNRKAHDFIPSRYWEDHFAAVRKMLLEAELYVYKDGNGIQGFAVLREQTDKNTGETEYFMGWER